MTRLYEGMFLIDNDTVRAGWRQAKKSLCDLLVKHGGEIQTARRWDERRLAYPIEHKNRATFLLAYFTLPNDAMPPLVRDLEIWDSALRHLIVRVEAVPEEEPELAQAEEADDFVVPEPPADDVVEAPAKSDERAEQDEDGRPSGDDDSSDAEKKKESAAEPAMAGRSSEKTED